MRSSSNSDDAIWLLVDSHFGDPCLSGTTVLHENHQVSMDLQDQSRLHDSLSLWAWNRVMPSGTQQTLFSLQLMGLQIEAHPVSIHITDSERKFTKVTRTF